MTRWQVKVQERERTGNTYWGYKPTRYSERTEGTVVSKLYEFREKTGYNTTILSIDGGKRINENVREQVALI